VKRASLPLQRRQFITLLGGAATWPLAVAAQQTSQAQCIGILMTAPQAQRAHLIVAFKQGLRDLGHLEGVDICFEIRSAEGHVERLSGLATELVNLGVAVMFADTTQAVQAAKAATTKIPIVMGSPGDPVGTGLVASLARPGGNVTGTTTLAFDLSRKRLQLLRYLLPGSARLAILWNSSNVASAENWRESEDAARILNLAVKSFAVTDAAELDEKLRAIRDAGVAALVVLPDSILFSEKRHLAEFAIKSRLPTMFEQREHVEAGGLMSYGPNLSELYRHASSFVDKILAGAKPADLPVEQPTKFELVINLNTAKTLGLQIPDKLLALADEVTE
jgi:putative ABC transport system substrate-binding protein